VDTKTLQKFLVAAKKNTWASGAEEEKRFGIKVLGPFVKEYKISFPTPMDKDATVAKIYGVVGLPTTFIVDKDGKIREKVMGDMTKEDVERLVKPLL